eukprot:3218503-Pleurochrysis_carterae.AAC.1
MRSVSVRAGDEERRRRRFAQISRPDRSLTPRFLQAERKLEAGVFPFYLPPPAPASPTRSRHLQRGEHTH